MKTFVCACEARIFFRNSRCFGCRRELGFLTDRVVHSALEPALEDPHVFVALAAPGARYAKCANYAQHDVCNWMVPAGDPERLCLSCRLNRTIPSLHSTDQRTLWHGIEIAKRHMIYTLLCLRLPLVPKSAEPDRGLAFDFLAPTEEAPVLTGHANGVITLNVLEADPVACEEMRVKLGERYRTVLGHFRHEIGHYYFGLLIENGPHLEGFRKLFGDERHDYADALERHYASAPQADWTERFISTYASAHPWEDWAETWAHYLHMRDTLETAQQFGLVAPPVRRPAGPYPESFEPLLGDWLELTVALNALNRSMGLPDPYPFQITDLPARKLAFIHDVVAAHAGRVAGR